MNHEEIKNFLTNEGMGVLGLPDEEAPYMIPMSFGYDGESQLYFSFFLGENSRKRDLSARTEIARFLVFSADSPFFWESVMLTGTLAELSEEEWRDHEAALDNAWHLDLFEQADSPSQIKLYEFTIQDQMGLKYTGLPPGLTGKASEESTE